MLQGIFERLRGVLGGKGEPVRFPPFPKGIPAEPVRRLVDERRDIIGNLRDTLGLGNGSRGPGEFDVLLAPLVVKAAEAFHLLPASRSHHHCYAGGLLTHALETAFLAAQSARGVLFPGARWPKERHDMEPRWRVACAVAGLLHDAGKPHTDLSVCDARSEKRVWDRIEPLAVWLRKNRVKRYFLIWNEDRHKLHETQTVAAAIPLIHERLRTYLQEYPLIWQTMIACLSYQDDGSVLSDLVRKADSNSVKIDLLTRAKEEDMDGSRHTPPETIAIQSMRALLQKGVWDVNKPGSRVFLDEEGVYLVHPIAFEELAEHMRRTNPGIFASPDYIVDILAQRGIAVPCELPGRPPSLLWPIRPACINKKGDAVLWAVRLDRRERVFGVRADFPDALPILLLEDRLGSAQSGESRPTERGGRPSSKPRLEAVSADGDTPSSSDAPSKAAPDPLADECLHGVASQLKRWVSEGKAVNLELVVIHTLAIKELGMDTGKVISALDGAGYIKHRRVPFGEIDEVKKHKCPWGHKDPFSLAFTREASRTIRAMASSSKKDADGEARPASPSETPAPKASPGKKDKGPGKGPGGPGGKAEKPAFPLENPTPKAVYAWAQSVEGAVLDGNGVRIPQEAVKSCPRGMFLKLVRKAVLVKDGDMFFVEKP